MKLYSPAYVQMQLQRAEAEIIDVVPPSPCREDQPKYLSWTVAAIVANNFVLGIILRAFDELPGPVFRAFFGMSPSQARLLQVIVDLAFGSKAVFGLVSDCFPIGGYRRKAYMLIGWALTFICMLLLAMSDHGTAISASAQQGTIVSIVCGVAAVGFVMASVACDGLMIELSKQEDDAYRGRLAALALSVLYAGHSMSGIVLAFLPRSSVENGNKFAKSLHAYFAVLATIVLALLIVILRIQETSREVVNCPQFIDEYWRVMQNSAVWKTLLFTFILSFFAAVPGSVKVSPYTYGWGQLSDKVQPYALALNVAVYAVFLLCVQKYSSSWNWRWTIGMSNLTQALCDGSVVILATYNIVRSQWYHFGVNVALQLPMAFTNYALVSAFIELAEPGQEATTSGMLTTLTEVVPALVPFVVSELLAPFEADGPIEFDSSHFRYLIAMPQLIGYVLYTVSSLCVFLFPRQRGHVQFLKRYGGRQPIMAALTLFICFGSIIAAITIAALNVSE